MMAQALNYFRLYKSFEMCHYNLRAVLNIFLYENMDISLGVVYHSFISTAQIPKILFVWSLVNAKHHCRLLSRDT